MAQTNSLPSAFKQEIDQLRQHIEYVDEQRRVTNRKVAEVEQQLELQRQTIASRENRIRDLEQRLSDANTQITRQSQFETRLKQIRDEMVQTIDQTAERLRDSIKEADKLKRVENEMVTREIADIRKELPAISRLEDQLDLRQAEDARLSNLVGTAHNQLNQIGQRFDPIINEVAYINEISKRHTTRLTEMEGQLLSANKKTEDVRPRIDLVADRLVHMEANITDITREQADVYKQIKGWTEQIQLGEYERKNRLDTWERYFDEQQEVMERYKKEWQRYNEQFQESKMAVESLAPWREQQEIRAREIFETQRLETNRLLAQWQNFIDDEDKKWRNFEIDTEQRIASRQRRETEFQKAIAALEDELVKMNQDREMLWRVQTAQADALKQFPRIWLEEVERTLEQNPYRRRQPTMVSVRED